VASSESPPTTAEPPLRTCRTCGNVERNFHYRCTNCGRDYAAPPPRFSKRAKVIAAAVAGAIIVVGLAIAIPALLTTKSEKTAKQSAADRAAAAHEAARLRVAQRPHPGHLAAQPDHPKAPSARRVAIRKAEVVAFETAITRDARARVAAGRLEGPVRETLCGPLQRGVRTGDELNVAIRIGRYDCVAVLRDVVKGGRVVGHFGHDYVGVIDFATGAYVLCQANPRESEAGRALATAPLPRACVNAHGGRLEGGFVQDPRDPTTPLPLLARAGRA
jgi:hypothetical protein